MPNKYYATPFFRISLAIYCALVIFSFAFWCNSAGMPTHNLWIPLSAYIALGFILVFFPSDSFDLPPLLVPIVQLLTLLFLQIMLDKLPTRMNIPALVPILLIVTLICSTMIQRNRPRAAWVLFCCSMLLVVKWHLGFYNFQYSVIFEFLIPAAVVSASHIFKHHIELATHRAQQSRVLLRNAKLGQAQERGVSDIASRRVAEVRELTEDMLHRIAYNPEPVTREEIDNFRFTEAHLRDTIRGHHLVNQEILEATLRARRRGAKVDILDERGEDLPEEVVQQLTTHAVDLLEDVTGGTVTIRAFPREDPVAVMIVHDGNSENEEPSAIEIDQSGNVEQF